MNVALRQELDLFNCLRPVRYFEGVPSPVKHPEQVDMVIFRENTEDIYAGIEWQKGTPEVKKVIDFLQNEMVLKISVSLKLLELALSLFLKRVQNVLFVRALIMRSKKDAKV